MDIKEIYFPIHLDNIPQAQQHLLPVAFAGDEPITIFFVLKKDSRNCDDRIVFHVFLGWVPFLAATGWYFNHSQAVKQQLDTHTMCW